MPRPAGVRRRQRRRCSDTSAVRLHLCRRKPKALGRSGGCQGDCRATPPRGAPRRDAVEESLRFAERDSRTGRAAGCASRARLEKDHVEASRVPQAAFAPSRSTRSQTHICASPAGEIGWGEAAPCGLYARDRERSRDAAFTGGASPCGWLPRYGRRKNARRVSKDGRSAK